MVFKNGVNSFLFVLLNKHLFTFCTFNDYNERTDCEILYTKLINYNVCFTYTSFFTGTDFRHDTVALLIINRTFLLQYCFNQAPRQEFVKLADCYSDYGRSYKVCLLCLYPIWLFVVT